MITTSKLSYAYNHGLLALKKNEVLTQIDLNISEGHIYGLLGKNGEGKTTLMKIMCGMLFPKQGTCRINDKDPAKRETNLLHQISYLPEMPSLSDVSPNTYFKTYAPFYPTFSQDILNLCISTFGIDPKRSIRTMSMGERKKVAISLAIAANTPILFMDEPTNGLDIPSKKAFRQIVASTMADERTIIISTHQVRDLEQLIDAVIILDGRQIRLNESTKNITDKLYFGSVGDDSNTLYSENSPIGRRDVGINTDNYESDIDLELLFNAFIYEPEKMKKIFA